MKPLFEKHRRRWIIAGATSKPKQVEQKVERQESEEPADPVEDPDTLHSSSYARIVDAISEGEIEGLCDKNGNLLVNPSQMGKGVFLDETPLQNKDGGWNFRGVQIGMTYGTPDQFTLNGFGKSADTIYSGAELKYNHPVTIGISNSNAETIEVAVRFQSMLRQDKKSGDVHGSQVGYNVQASLNGGSFNQLEFVAVTGKCRQPYLKTTSHRLPHSGSEGDTWSIRIIRTTPEPTGLEEANATSVDYITVYTKNRFRYPYTALIAAEVAARGFSGIPARAYRIKGIRVRVPNNYFPETREYNRDYLTGDPVTGEDDEPVEQIWNGGFYVAWTNNPAWIFFDLLTNTRYGCGQEMGVTPDRPDGRVDKWQLYPISKYCDEMIDDGFGGIEPRFACSVYLQAREEAFKVIQDFATVFRGTVFWQGGAIAAVQDRPETPFIDFTNANVIDGVFTYSGTGRKARHTTVAVRYSDETNMFKPAFEYVSDPVGIAKYGIRETTIAAFACCSRGQAHRLGRWVLTTELYQTEMETHRAGMIAAVLRPGHVYRVLNNNRAGVVQGGRLQAVAGDMLSVTLDRDVTIPAGAVTVSMGRPAAFIPPGAVEDSGDIAAMRTPQVVELTVTNGATATTRTLTFAEAIPEEIAPGAIWVMKTPSVEPELFRLVNIEERGPADYEITGLKYLPSKYASIEQGIELELPDVSDLPENPGDVMPPINVTLERNAVVTAEGVTLKIIVSWEAPPSAMVEAYVVEKRLGADNWERVETTKATHSEFRYTVPGTYQVKVTSSATFGGKSEGIIAQIVIADENPIELYRVTGLELTGQGNDTNFIGRDARFQWRLNSPATGLELDTHGTQDPYFLDYEVSVWDVTTGLQIYRETATDTFFVFTYSKNSEVAGGPRNQFRVEVRGRDKYGNTTAAAILTVQNPAPAPPTALSVAAAWRVAHLRWINPADLDLEAIQIWTGTTNVFADAVLVATVTADAFTHTGIEVGVQRWYWVRAVDTFGSLSTLEPSAGLSVTPGALDATDIAAFAIDATRMFSEVIVLKGAVWTDNSPTAGKIAWDGHTVVFRGVEWPIAAGNTADAFVWWRGPVYDGTGALTSDGEATYRTSATHPADGVSPEMTQRNDFMIATNADGAGVADLAWRGFANAVIGSAWIAGLKANKILAGTIDSQEITIAGTGKIQSDDFATGSDGWKIDGDGSAEFNNVTVRGILETSTIKNDSVIVVKNHPANRLQSIVTQVEVNAGWDYEWGGANTTRIVVGGAWSGTAITGGTAFNRSMTMLPSGCRFVGCAVADGGTYDASRDNRLGTDATQMFTFQMHCNNPGDVAIMFRLWPASIAAPPDSSTTYPWILTYAATGNFSGRNSFAGLFNLAVPEGYVIDFSPAPVNSSGSSGGAVDVINDLSLIVQTANP